MELTAMLCREYALDPLADGVVICHQEGYRQGVASNHGDVLHWFPKHGKTMEDFRADVAGLMNNTEEDEDMPKQRNTEGRAGLLPADHSQAHGVRDPAG